MSRKICVVTGTRAEYGLLRWVMEGIRRRPELELQLVVTGMHLSPEFGSTYREIEGDGFRIDRRVEMLLSSDTPVGVATSMGIGLAGIATALNELSPDVMVLLGDRFEILSAAAAGLVSRIPIAHLHGGETTEGAFDEAIRHSVTKMSQLHFVAAEEYRRRVIQLGEQPERVYVVGGLGIDGIKRLPLLDRKALEAALQCSLGSRSMLITFHPSTLENDTASAQMTELLAALEGQSDTRLIFTMPNADTGSRGIAELIREFVATHENAVAFESLGQLRYLSSLRHVDVVVGNSSSGLTEAPTFGKATVNIGERQRGRLKAASVIDAPPERRAIAEAIAKASSADFQSGLPTVRNPYGDGGASDRIVDILATVSLAHILMKQFNDISIE